MSPTNVKHFTFYAINMNLTKNMALQKSSRDKHSVIFL